MAKKIMTKKELTASHKEVQKNDIFYCLPVQKTQEELIADFKEDLRELLARYNATLTAELAHPQSESWEDPSPIGYLEVDICPQKEPEGDEPWPTTALFSLGTSFDGTSK